MMKIIKKCEKKYSQTLMNIASNIKENNNILFILVAGASCSGKTTTTKLLGQNLASLGIHAEQVSLDDFYKEDSEMQRDSQGKFDFETIDSLDINMIHDTLSRFASGREVWLPTFDFTSKKRKKRSDSITLNLGEVVIIEGLHALNPLIYSSFVSENSVYKIYLKAESPDYDAKLLRRLVRDSYFRGADAEMTFSMWDSVKNGEKKYIVPFEKDANKVVKTFFEYEKCIFSARATELLSKIKSGTQYSEKARELTEMLAYTEKIGYENIPKNSLMWEFVKL